MSLDSHSNALDAANGLAAALGAVCHALAEAREQTRWLDGELAEQPLGSAEFLLVWIVGSETSAGLAQHELAEQVGLSPAQASVLLEKLRRSGWLASVRDEHDRRKQRWQLTPQGRENLEAISNAIMSRGKTQGQPSLGLVSREAAA